MTLRTPCHRRAYVTSVDRGIFGGGSESEYGCKMRHVEGSEIILVWKVVIFQIIRGYTVNLKTTILKSFQEASASLATEHFFVFFHSTGWKEFAHLTTDF